MRYFRFPKYVSVAERKASAEKKLKKMQKKDPSIQPVVIQGKNLAKTWWGKAWNDNLTKYADFANRVGRGRSYLRHGAVLDLKINPGEVLALVQGSDVDPYQIQIDIKRISKSNWEDIKRLCVGKIESLQELLKGKFPKNLADVFTSKNAGLFPSPKELNFSCSCPDWASMCKHVAAALYGVGTRLDDDPMLFFKLRGVDSKDLVAQAVKDNTNQLLERSKKKSNRVIDDIDIADIFDIDMESAPDKKAKKSEKKKVVLPKVKKSKKTIENPKKKEFSKKKSSITKTQKTTKQSHEDESDLILKVIRRSRKGVDIPTLQKRTGIKDKQRLYNAVYKLCDKNNILRVARGVYKKAETNL